jgi:hypothetical protein
LRNRKRREGRQKQHQPDRPSNSHTEPNSSQAALIVLKWPSTVSATSRA